RIHNVNIFIDEFAFFNHLQREKILNLIRYGRQKNITLIIITRRIQEFKLEFISQYDTILVFNTDAERDIEYLERIVDEKVDKEKIKKLKTFEFLVYGEKNYLKYI
ncbi:MAG: hypothetical protein ABIK72_07480, partial [candidate division WOR-3 bacterium]